MATAYISIVPSARGIEGNIARELAPVTTVAAKQGETAGAALGTGLVTKFSSSTGNLLQGVERQLGNFGAPQLGVLSNVGKELQVVQGSQLLATSGAAQFGSVATAAYLGVGAAAVGLGVSSAHAFLEGQDASANYAQALHVVGASHEELDPKIDATVKKMAGFGFENDAVELSAAQLTRATKDANKALDDVTLAADISAARRIDLAQATNLLVKVETGHVALLGRYGIDTKDATGKTISQEEAIKRLSALYAGSAAAASKTYAGELRAVGATAHNLEEELGGKVLPIVANVGKELLSGVHGLEEINDATDHWLGTLTGVTLIGGATFIAVSKIGSGVGKLVTTFEAQRVATDAIALSDTAAATAAGARATSSATLIDLEQAELAASLQLTAANEALAASLDSVAFAGAGAAASDAQIAAASATAAEAELAFAAASAEAAAASGTSAVTAGFLGTGLSGAGVAGLGAVAGIGAFIGTTKLLDSIVGATKPNVDDLAGSLRALEKGTGPGPDFSALAGDLRTIKGSTFEKGFGLSGSSHQAVADIDAENDALKEMLKTEGVDKATRAYGLLTQGLLDQGISIGVVGSEFHPFIEQLDLANAKEHEVSGTTDELKTSFEDLTSGFAKEGAILGIADQFDSARSAVEELEQLKLDAAGQGKKSTDAARAEQSAQQSLSDAYRSQSTAATSLADAKSKLAQFDGPTDTRIRVLEQQNIESRVVTTPEEARQKEIDLLQFSEDNTNKRADLQRQVESAENSVTSATEGVAKAQQAVSTASAARKQVQVDAAAAIAGAERKAQEAILNAGKAVSDADVAGQLGRGNTQLDIYVGLLDQLSNRVAPNSPLTKRLNDFLSQVQLTLLGKKLLEGSQPIAGPQGPPRAAAPAAALRPVPIPTQTLRPGQSLTGQPVVVDARQHNEFKGGGIPTTTELDILNKKQAIRLSAAITGGRH